MYLVFKENILIATLLKRGNKNVDIKFSAHERFWNNLHQVAQNQKNGEPNNLIVLGAQDLWVFRGGCSGGRPRRPPPPKIGKNMIFWRKIVIFHTKYPKNVRASLRSAQFF